jgi:hypothetical protein
MTKTGTTQVVNEAILKRAYRKADRAQAMLHRPNVSQSAREKAHEMLREARNLTARAHGMPEIF